MLTHRESPGVLHDEALVIGLFKVVFELLAGFGLLSYWLLQMNPSGFPRLGLIKHVNFAFPIRAPIRHMAISRLVLYALG